MSPENISENTSKEADQIVAFMSNCSLEVTPGGAAKIDDFRDVLRSNQKVYVTFLPGSDFRDTVATVRKLKDHGMQPVPHFAARSIPGKTFFEENLKMLTAETGVEEALLIGGAVENPVGDFSESLEILRLGLFEKYGIKSLGLAGHPEGSPDIPESEVTRALLEKNAYAKESPLHLYLVTQFCFEAAPLISWDKHIRAEGNELPIHIGIPGLATLKSLLKHAQACGIGNSMRLIVKQARNVAKLMSVREPDSLVRDLAAYKATDPDCGIVKTHLYPLGGLKKSAAWLYAVQDARISLNADSGFRTDWTA